MPASATEINLTGDDIAPADGITLEATNTLLVIQNASGEGRVALGS